MTVSCAQRSSLTINTRRRIQATPGVDPLVSTRASRVPHGQIERYLARLPRESQVARKDGRGSGRTEWVGPSGLQSEWRRCAHPFECHRHRRRVDGVRDPRRRRGSREAEVRPRRPGRQQGGGWQRLDPETPRWESAGDAAGKLAHRQSAYGLLDAAREQPQPDPVDIEPKQFRHPADRPSGSLARRSSRRSTAARPVSRETRVDRTHPPWKPKKAPKKKKRPEFSGEGGIRTLDGRNRPYRFSCPAHGRRNRL